MITAHVLTREGEFLVQSVTSLIPFVEMVIIVVDSRTLESSSESWKDVSFLERKYPGRVFGLNVLIEKPDIDLVKARNTMIKMTSSKYVWVLDDDEYYPKSSVKKILKSLDGSPGFAVECWSPWNDTHAHIKTSDWVTRIFLNKELEWRGTFGHEKPFSGDKHLWQRTNPEIKRIKNARYLHLTHLKQPKWREKMNMQRKADGRYLTPMPKEYVEYLKKIKEYKHENM